jgi:hypothetical protein
MRIPHRLLIGQMQRDVSAAGGSQPAVAGVNAANGSPQEKDPSWWRWFRLSHDRIGQETLFAV